MALPSNLDELSQRLNGYRRERPGWAHPLTIVKLADPVCGDSPLARRRVPAPERRPGLTSTSDVVKCPISRRRGRGRCLPQDQPVAGRARIGLGNRRGCHIGACGHATEDREQRHDGDPGCSDQDEEHVISCFRRGTSTPPIGRDRPYL